MKVIRPYHFAQFRPAGFLPFYRAIVAADGIVCFDFEDSIQAETEVATARLKQEQRRQVRQLLQGPGPQPERLAVRINAPNTPHYGPDLAALRGLPGLHAVFVPKVEHPDHLRQVLRELPLPVRHLVAVVETQAGFAALPALLALRDARLGLVAFGHCDYNLSRGHFPFFHHDAPRYWEWLAELDAHLHRSGRQLLNSPVLQLADAALFQDVLGRLRAHPSATGQITLCLSQTRACAAPVGPVPARTLAARLPESAQPLRARFEQARLPGRAFAVDATRRLISPHEYEAARAARPAMRLTIVGGCFPVQHNIEPARLYHATLRGLLAPYGPAGAPEVEVVRYERFENCLQKIRAAHARQPTQVLLFHLRAEPVMRLAKLYYRYLDDQGRVRHTLNLPGQAHATPERFDLLTRPRPAAPAAPPPESTAHRRLRQLNLRLGAWAGNRRRALRHYETLVAAVAGFCRAEGIRLLLIGPVSRPCTREENRLSEQLNAYFEEFARRQGLAYLPTLGTADAAGQPLFFPNGVHVSPAGHDRIAQLLYQRLRPPTCPQSPPPVLLESDVA